jgi:hypothetical protein
MFRGLASDAHGLSSAFNLRICSRSVTILSFTHVIVKELGEQNALRSVLALHKALHQEPRLNPSGF